MPTGESYWQERTRGGVNAMKYDKILTRSATTLRHPQILPAIKEPTTSDPAQDAEYLCRTPTTGEIRLHSMCSGPSGRPLMNQSAISAAVKLATPTTTSSSKRHRPEKCIAAFMDRTTTAMKSPAANGRQSTLTKSAIGTWIARPSA